MDLPGMNGRSFWKTPENSNVRVKKADGTYTYYNNVEDIPSGTWNYEIKNSSGTFEPRRNPGGMGGAAAKQMNEIEEKKEEEKKVELPKEEEKELPKEENPVVKENLTTEEKPEETKVEETSITEEKPVEEEKEKPVKETKDEKKARQTAGWLDALKGKDLSFLGLLKNKNISGGKKAALIGEMLSTIASGAVRGAIGDTSEHKGLLQQTIQDAINKGNERTQAQAEAANKASIAKDERLSWVENSRKLNYLPSAIKEEIANALVDSPMSEDEFYNTVLKDVENLTPESKKEIYDAYDYLRRTNVEGMNIQKQSEDLKQMKFKTKEVENNFKASIRAEIRELQDNIIKLQTAPYKEGVEIFNNYLAGRRGLQTAVSAFQKSKEDSSSGEIKGAFEMGVPKLGKWLLTDAKGSVEGGASGSRTRNESENNSVNMDLLASAEIPNAEKLVDDFKNDYDAAKETAIKLMKNQIKELQALLNENSRVNDAVIKADGQPTKIVKENGEEIEISPDDNIYVTKNEIETEKDNGESVIPLEQDDRVSIIQKNLGYEGGAINKNFNYYLDRLNALEV